TESVRAIGGPSRAQANNPPPPIETAVAAPPPAAAPPAGAPPPINISTLSQRHLRVFEMPASLRPDTVIPDAPVLDPLAALPLAHTEAFLHPVIPASAPKPGNPAEASIKVRVEPVPGSRMPGFAKHIPLVGKRYRRPDYTPPAPLGE